MVTMLEMLEDSYWSDGVWLWWKESDDVSLAIPLYEIMLWGGLSDG